LSGPGRLRWFLRVLLGFVRRELSAVGDYRTALILRLFGFVLVVGSLLFLSRFVGAAANPHLTKYGGNYLGFAAIGFLAAEFQQVGVSGLAQRIRMSQIMGTLEAEVATPAAPWMVLGAPPIYEFAAALLRSAVYLTGATVLLGLDLSFANWLTVAISVPLIGCAFAGLGLLAAGTTMLVRRINPVAMIISSLSFFLSGVMYPVSVLPSSLRALGQLLPLTHALEVLRGGLLVGAGPASVGESMFALFLFAVVLAPTGAGVFAYALKRARADGSLSHY
jgi:ABC-type polysaccharide/polyol phosphate export permease